MALFGLGCGGAGEPFYIDFREMPRRVHVVDAEGESVCALAGRYGVAAPALLRANGLTGSGQKLAEGTRVRLPSEPLRHRITQGETLAGLARWYGFPVTRLAEANGISDPDQIAVDHWLRVPPGARTGCPPIAVARAPAAQPAPETESSVEQPEPETESFDAAPLTTVARAPAEQPAPETECSHVEARRMLERAQSSYDAAHFEEALDLAKASQRLLEADGGGRNPIGCGHARPGSRASPTPDLVGPNRRSPLSAPRSTWIPRSAIRRPCRPKCVPSSSPPASPRLPLHPRTTPGRLDGLTSPPRRIQPGRGAERLDRGASPMRLLVNIAVLVALPIAAVAQEAAHGVEVLLPPRGGRLLRNSTWARWRRLKRAPTRGGRPAGHRRDRSPAARLGVGATP